MSRLLHVGSAVVDYVYRIDALPRLGTEKTASSHYRSAGGGFNLMAAARRAGMAVIFAGKHGAGPNGDFLREAFGGEGVEVLLPPTEDIDSGNSVVILTDDAERTFVSWPGAEGHMTSFDLAGIVPRSGDWAFTSGYTLSYPGSREALAGWVEQLGDEIPFVLDPTPVIGDIPPGILQRLLARVDWLSCNEREAEFITGHAGPGFDVAGRLMARHCLRAAGVVIREGEDGAVVRLRDGACRAVPGFKVDAIDTNGAGDTHIGAFISALARGADPFEATRYANAAAAISVTRHGGSSAPTHEETMSFLSERDGTISAA